jgi:glycosyltransferase involved in cell wall biosynthesis
MNIGVVHDCVDGGGSPLVVRNQVRHLSNRDNNVTFVTSPETMEKALTSFPHVRCVSFCESRSVLCRLLKPWHIIMTILLLRLHIVIIHSVRAASYFGFFAILCGCRVVVVEHNNPNVGPELTKRQRSFLKVVLRRSTAVCVSQGSARAFKETFGAEAQVVYNFVQFAANSKTAKTVQRDSTIVFLARLAPQKRASLLIDCFEKIAPECDWRLEIYGAGEELEMLLKKADSSKYKSRIKFGGWIDQPDVVYERAGIFVLTSYHEGFGITLIEAMSLGTPCVSFDCPFGPNEIIEHGRSGMLVENGNVDQLAKVLLDLIRDPNLRDQLGTAGIDRSAKFNLNVHNCVWDRLIDRAYRYKSGSILPRANLDKRQEQKRSEQKARQEGERSDARAKDRL